jgi:hypothetical protein
MATQKEFEKVINDLQKKALTDKFLNEFFGSKDDNTVEEKDERVQIKIPYVSANPICGAKWA